MMSASWSVIALALITTQDYGVETFGSDCDTSALYVLLRLEGYRVDLDKISSVLGDTPDQGFSLFEIQKAAQGLGLPLHGVQYSSLPHFDRPVLVYLNRHPHGHFVVVRPIGHSGTLVQVFDGLGLPKVVDISQLLADPVWTGIALYPRRWQDDFPLIIGILGTILAALLFLYSFIHWAIKFARLVVPR